MPLTRQSNGQRIRTKVESLCYTQEGFIKAEAIRTGTILQGAAEALERHSVALDPLKTSCEVWEFCRFIRASCRHLQCLANSENTAEGYKSHRAEGEYEAKAGSFLRGTSLGITYKSFHAVRL